MELCLYELKHIVKFSNLHQCTFKFSLQLYLKNTSIRVTSSNPKKMFQNRTSVNRTMCRQFVFIYKKSKLKERELHD